MVIEKQILLTKWYHMNIRKISIIAGLALLGGTFAILLFKEITGHTRAGNTSDTLRYNASDTSMYNTPDTSAYHGNPTNTYTPVPGSTYSTNHYSTNRSRRRSVSYHRGYSSRSSYAARNTVVRRRGWSSAAKGTVIGAGSGAVLGAVVAGDNRRVGGAVIGGVIGAAGGYLYGRHRDKKHRRY